MALLQCESGARSVPYSHFKLVFWLRKASNPPISHFERLDSYTFINRPDPSFIHIRGCSKSYVKQRDKSVPVIADDFFGQLEISLGDLFHGGVGRISIKI